MRLVESRISRLEEQLGSGPRVTMFCWDVPEKELQARIAQFAVE